jgi:murein DD-endopeptidase MepM/ murein hydrolase activator NlpD
MKKVNKCLFLILLAFLLSGCAGRGYQRGSFIADPSMPGIYHRVQRGETLWGISKRYKASLDEIVKINRMPDASKINAGQSIFIPYAQEVREVRSLERQDSSFIWPVKGEVVTHFEMKQNNVRSKGIVIRAPEGESVLAARSGKVSFSDDKVKGMGRVIILDHGDGFATVYAHNSANLVKAGDTVRQGQRIARVGTSGRADSPRLYFEIREAQVPKNPFYYLP